ncbi:MAG: SAM-dependent methyltransferase [Myxococcota bacterium]
MPIAMSRGYSLDTLGAKICLERAWDMLDRAVDEIPLGPTVRYIDFGTADGGTMVETWARVLDRLRRRDAAAFLELCCVDLPRTDFNTLAHNTDRVVADRPRAAAHLIPRSFYSAVSAPGTMRLGFSSTAMHWLSQRPGPLTTHTHPNATDDDGQRAAYQAQAARDFEQILLRRAEELAIGGQMVLVNLATDAQGRFLGKNGVDENMHDVLHELWRGMWTDGLIEEAHYHAAVINNYYKSDADFTAPFLDESGAVWRAGLRLKERRTESIPCPYRARFEEDGDVQVFAEGLMRTVRSWSEHAFLTAVQDGDAPQQRVDTFYQRYQDRIARQPHRHSMDYVEHYLRLEKVSG